MANNHRLIKRNLGPKLESSRRPNTIGMTPRQLNHMLDRLEAETHKEPGSQHRIFSRWPFREQHVDVLIQHPGGSDVTLKLACRNLSKGGVALLHSAFVYPGTRVLVMLPHPEKGLHAAGGRVARCEHRQGVVHEVGVRFDEELDPREFVPTSPLDALLAYERVNPAEVMGSVCIAEPVPTDLRVIRQFLNRTGLRIVEVTGGMEAVHAAQDGVDAVITAFELSDMTGAEVAGKVHHEGLGTPVIVTGTEMDDRVRSAVSSSPVAAYLLKPLVQDVLLRALAEFVKTGQGSGRRAVSSDAKKAFREQLGALARQLEVSVEKGRAMDIYAVCTQLAGAAPTLGYDGIGDVAARVAARLSRDMDLETARGLVSELAGICRNSGKRAA